MTFAIEILDVALDQLRGLPKKALRQVTRRIRGLASDPCPGNAKKLQNTKVPDLYRIRSGDYRIVYQIRRKRLLVLVIRIGHRKDVYRNLAALSVDWPTV